MRVTQASLNQKAITLNTLLGRPTDMFVSKVGEQPCIFSIGHLTVDSNGMGYELQEQASDGGGTHNISGRMTAKEMSIMLEGMIKGAYMMRRKVEGK